MKTPAQAGVFVCVRAQAAASDCVTSSSIAPHGLSTAIRHVPSGCRCSTSAERPSSATGAPVAVDARHAPSALVERAVVALQDDLGQRGQCRLHGEHAVERGAAGVRAVEQLPRRGREDRIGCVAGACGVEVAAVHGIDQGAHGGARGGERHGGGLGERRRHCTGSCGHRVSAEVSAGAQAAAASRFGATSREAMMPTSYSRYIGIASISCDTASGGVITAATTTMPISA